MKKRILGLVLACAVLVAGLCACSGGAASSSTAASSTASSAASAAADRYDEVTKVPEGKFSIYYLDLKTGPAATDKSGDSSVLISPDGKVMLIDSGHPDCSGDVVDFLQALGIKHIDYFVLTHPHIDHIGGVVAVLKNFDVDTVYRTTVEYNSSTYVDADAYLNKCGVPVEYLQAGDSFSFGDSIHVDVFNPPTEITYPEGFPANSTQFLNNTSISMKFTYGKSTYLSCGDLYLNQERALVDEYGDALQADVIKANHHGNDTSNGRKWVEAVKPKYVVAMNDSIGSMDVYTRYTKAGAAYYNTSLDGYLRISMDDAANYEAVTQYDSWLRTGNAP